MNRRSLLLTGCSAVAGTVFSKDDPPRSTGIGPRLEPLGYDFGALEPYLDRETLRDHYSKLHAEYVVKLNATLKSVHLEVSNVISLLPVIKTLPTPANPNSVLNFSQKPGPLPEKIQAQLRDYAGGHANHTIFWRYLAPHGSGPAGPEAKVAEAIQAEFGSIADFKLAFTQAALKHPGKGWAWLVYRPDGRLVITTTANNDHPSMADYVPKEETGRPILCLDLWNHSLSLRYKNNREGYVSAWWNVVNWARVTKGYAVVSSGRV